MIEMLMYLGLVMVISVGAFRLYGESVEKTRRIDLMSRMEDIKKAVKLTYIGRDWDAVTEDARAANLEGKGVKMSTPWGGKILVGVSPIAGQYARPIFIVKVHDLTSSACTWLVSQLGGDAACVTANGTSYLAEANCIKDPADAVAKCNKTDNANEVDAVYYKD
jgi:hypothetical protein